MRRQSFSLEQLGFLGVTYEEKLRNVYFFYERFIDEEVTLDKLSHLEEFAMATNVRNKAGREFMRTNFPKYQKMYPLPF